MDQFRVSNNGTTFKLELMRARRQNAEKMLGESNLQIEEISQALGYKESGNFTRAFGRWTGVPPNTWRRQRRGELEQD